MTALLGMCFVMNAFSQITLSGKVVDAKTGRPVEGANVRLERTTIGSATNAKGEFTVKNIPDGKYVLRASCLDYAVVKRNVDKSQTGMIIKLKESFVNLEQVVITGTGTHHKLKDSPVPVEVISQKELKNANANNLEDALLKLAPSVSFQSTSMGNNIYMNGLSGKYVLILIDGKKVAGDVSGNVDFSRINIANVKRIEILKGAASALYGSDAMAGVINIITDKSKNLLNVMSNSRISSHGRFTQSLNADVNAGKFSSNTSYQRQQSDGWKLSDYELVKDELVETDKQVAYKSFTNDINQSFTYRATDKLSFDMFGTYSTYENDRNPVTEYNIVHKTYQYGGSAKYLLPNASYLEATANTTNFRSFNDYTMDKKPYKAGERTNSKDMDYTNANLKGVFNLGNYNTLNAGFDYTGDALKTSETSILGNNENKTMYTLALYAQDEIKIADFLRVVAGFRYIYHETFKNRLNPKLSVMYQYNGFNLRASYASAFRAPTLQQLYAISEKNHKITVGSTNLKPETSNFYDLNAEYNNQYFSVSVSTYWNEIRNLIDYKEIDLTAEDIANKITSRKEYANIGKARIKGLDASFNVRPGCGFSFGASYNYTDAKDITENTPLERSVEHSGSVNAGWTKTWDIYTLNVNVNGRYQGTRYSKTYDSAPAFQMWDLNTRHVIRLKAFTLEPGVGVENIFNYTDDRPYNNHYATINPGRSFYASLLVRFKQ